VGVDMKIGIIPAGGKATRWGGFPKELLPTNASWTLLDRMFMLQTRALVDRVMLVSSKDKYLLHKWYVEDKRGWPNASIILADSVKDSIIHAINAVGDADFIFSMPDTITDIPLFPETIDAPLMLGLFETELSDRFGMIRDGQIVDKQDGPPGQAWGAFMFTNEVARFWRRVEKDCEDHTELLNAAMKEFKGGSWTINMYHDIASFNDYLRMLEVVYAKK